jgi:hypothetical protein
MADDPTNADDTPDDELTPTADDAADAESGSSPSKAGGTTAPKTAPKAAAGAAGGQGLGVGAKPVVRKKVASKRVTPKGGAVHAGKQGSTAARTHAPGGKDANTSSRYTPPTAKYADMPSPMWVPVLMFTLLIVGAFVIIANYARLFGDPSNVVLVAGLGCILGGIITATNYR